MVILKELSKKLNLKIDSRIVKNSFPFQKKIDDIEKIINEIHPADIADILEILNEKDNDKLKEIIENKKYAEAIIELDDNVKNIFLSKFDDVFTLDILKDKMVEKTEAKVAIIQICSQYFGKTCIGILHPKKFGFIISDNI